MDFIQQIGAAALGSRFRRLAEVLASDAAEIYKLYEVELEPGWFPIFHLLSQQQSATITELAQQLGHSHPFVSKTVKQMKQKELLHTVQKGDDKRVNSVELTAKGRSMVPKLATQLEDVATGVELVLGDNTEQLLALLSEFEAQTKQQSLLSRVKRIRKSRESQLKESQLKQSKPKENQSIEIIPFKLEYSEAFFRLNRLWIEQHFVLEEADIRALANPKDYILDQGGEIFLARDESGNICGTCAMIKMDGNEYELAKMAVDESYKGRGIGYLLGRACIDWATEVKADKVYLESNRKLTPAINLYKKLGFVELEQSSSPYARCDIQMELLVDE